MKKIDIHCHTTNRPVEKVLPKDSTLETIAKEMQKHSIEKTVLLATYFPHRGSGISNFRLLEWIQNHNKKENVFLMFGSLDFEHYFYQGYNELEELGERNLISGIKIYTCYQHIDFKSDEFKKVIELSQKNKWPIMHHLGYTHTRTQKDSCKVMPNELEFMAENEQPIIASHLAKPMSNKLIEVVKRNKTIYADMSGLISSYDEKNEMPESIENIKKFLGECGPEKLLFGTDFPIQTHEDSIFMIETAMKNYADGDKNKVYYGNASRLLGLKW